MYKELIIVIALVVFYILIGRISGCGRPSIGATALANHKVYEHQIDSLQKELERLNYESDQRAEKIERMRATVDALNKNNTDLRIQYEHSRPSVTGSIATAAQIKPDSLKIEFEQRTRALGLFSTDSGSITTGSRYIRTAIYCIDQKEKLEKHARAADRLIKGQQAQIDGYKAMTEQQQDQSEVKDSVINISAMMLRADSTEIRSLVATIKKQNTDRFWMKLKAGLTFGAFGTIAIAGPTIAAIIKAKK